MRLSLTGGLLSPVLGPVRVPAAAAPSVPRRRTAAWASVGAALVVAVTGLVVVDHLAGSRARPPFALFWAAYGLELGAVAVTLVRLAASDRGRLLVLAGHGGITFLPKLLMSSTGPVYFDEPGHWRHAKDVLALGRLDVPTPWLPIEQHYPGLAAATAGLAKVTGLGTWHAGQVLVLLAHAGVLLALFWTARTVGLGGGAAGTAALLYSLNPNYLFFDAQYGYESVGLPLAVLTAALLLRARRAGTARGAQALAAAALVSGLATVVTHHVSGLVAAVLGLLVAAAVPARRPVRAATWAPAAAAVLTGTGLVLWVLLAARPTVGYIAPHVRAGVLDTVALLRHGADDQGRSRALFGGSTVPAYEKAAGFLVPPLAGLAVLAALVATWRDRAALRLLVPFLALAVLYAASLPLALTVSGSESAHRAWGYGWAGLAVLAPVGAPVWLAAVRRLRPALRGGLALALLLVVAVGSTGAGSSVRYRFPGPVEFGTDSRSSDPELIALARWLDLSLPAGSRVVTDRFTGEAVIGRTRLGVPTPQESLVYRLYREGGAPSLRLRAYLRDHGFRWFVLDRRVLTRQPAQKLFQGWAGPVSVSPAALSIAGATPFLRSVHRTDRYLVLEVRP